MPLLPIPQSASFYTCQLFEPDYCQLPFLFSIFSIEHLSIIINSYLEIAEKPRNRL